VARNLELPPPVARLFQAADEQFSAFVSRAGAALRRWRSGSVADNPLAYARRVITNEYLGWRRLRSLSDPTSYSDGSTTGHDATDVVTDELRSATS
jgi:hypothetical protein